MTDATRQKVLITLADFGLRTGLNEQQKEELSQYRNVLLFAIESEKPRDELEPLEKNLKDFYENLGEIKNGVGVSMDADAAYKSDVSNMYLAKLKYRPGMEIAPTGQLWERKI